MADFDYLKKKLKVFFMASYVCFVFVGGLDGSGIN